MNNIERTIAIRKRIHIDDGVVRERKRPGYAVDGEPINVTDISCTVSVDVPVLTGVPLQTFDQFVAAYCVTHGWDASALSKTQVLEARREACVSLRANRWADVRVCGVEFHEGRS
jgi:hypothetical protein